MSLGFIIIRNIINNLTAQYWIECYKCIRNHYNNEIIIVDDNSIPEFVNDTEISLVNCKIIHSEWPKRGELNALYYFHKLHPFDKAVILHDSVFINSKIDFESVHHIRFLWSIGTHKFDKSFEIMQIMQYMHN